VRARADPSFSGPNGAEEHAKRKNLPGTGHGRLALCTHLLAWPPGAGPLGPEETKNVQHEYTTPPVMHQSPTAQITVKK